MAGPPTAVAAGAARPAAAKAAPLAASKGVTDSSFALSSVDGAADRLVREVVSKGAV